MAQFAYDGGQHGDHFYPQEFPFGDPTFSGFPENNLNPPGSILGPNDTSLLKGFFQNPDGLQMTNDFTWSDNHSAFRLDGSGLEPLPDFDPGNQTLFGHSFGLGAQTGQEHGHLTHQAHLQQLHQQPQNHVPNTPHVNYLYNNQPNDPTSDEAITAAMNLQNLHHQQNLPHAQMVSHQRSSSSLSAQHMNGIVGGGSWGGMQGGNQIVGGQGQGQRGDQVNLRSPLTSGRQSSHDFHEQQQQQLASPGRPGYQTEQNWMAALHNNQQPTMLSAHPHGHQAGMPDYRPSIGQYGYGGYPNYAQQQQMPKPGGFGSDTAFGGGRYQAPIEHRGREAEIGGNLNNVPFAEQLAAQSHAHPLTPDQLHRARYHQNLQVSTNFGNTQLSPTYRGGLPNMTPSTAQTPTYSAGTMPLYSADGQNLSDDDAESQGLRPSKRRKSVRDDEDDDYNPKKGAKKTNKSRRSSKVAKVENSHDEIIVDTPAKRRKTSSGNRSSPGSQEYTSPRGNYSETPEAEPKSSSRKKKSSASQPRSNLTEEEKRQNHIRSEKVRRDLIKAQYDALDVLVPGLKSGKSGLSRADVLLEIVNFVENVKTGNEKAEHMIAVWSPSMAGASGGNG